MRLRGPSLEIENDAPDEISAVQEIGCLGRVASIKRIAVGAIGRVSICGHVPDISAQADMAAYVVLHAAAHAEGELRAIRRAVKIVVAGET